MHRGSNRAAKRVLICTPSHATQGGVERIIESLHDGLPAHGLSVVVGLARGERFHHPERYRAAYPQLDCIEIDGRSGTREGRLRGLRQVLRAVQPDIVLIARLGDAYQAVCERKLAGEDVRLAVTVQAYEPEYLVDLSHYAGFVDVCVTSGQLLANAAARFTTVPAERIRSIPGGVAPARVAVTHTDDRPLRLGYVGRVEQHQKRIFDLVDVLSELARTGVPFTCTVAGGGDAEDELRCRLAARGLDHAVAMHGWLSTPELYDRVYPQLDVLLHFAAWEGVTIAPREAMAHGVVPVISRFTGCLVEGQFRHEDNALTFDVGDAPAAAASVRRLHEDRSLLRRLSESARRSQRGINSADGALRAWAEAFHEALDSTPRLGSRLAEIPAAPSGRLERWGMPAAWAEAVRRLAGRRARHEEPGGEWPHHCLPAGAAGRLQAIADFARAEDHRHRFSTAAR